MIAIGAFRPTEGIPQPPDTIQTLLIAASSGQAMDWASTLTQIVRISMQSTVGAAANCYVSLDSTRAAAPSSGNSTGSTAGTLPSIPVPTVGRFLQKPADSTGFSVAALSSGYVTVECWRM
jgi:hypothetical protein